ncbi:MAG TPA: methyltransferase [Allosphingosinicella sp.]|jgi:protein-S-isoprenylcysteine O-methyltransferase Ste14
MQAELTASTAGELPAGEDRWSLVLDVAERLFLLLLGGWMVYRFVPAIGSNPFAVLVVTAEMLIVVFALIRRTGQASNTLRAWTVAIIGTCLPLMVNPTGLQLIPLPAAGFLMMLGLLVNIGAKLALSRSFGIVAANRGVRRIGPYRLVRHPMYFGYLITHVGFFLMCCSIWNAIVYGACWLSMLLRIELEEAVLSEDEEYCSYRGAVKYKLIPFVW